MKREKQALKIKKKIEAHIAQAEYPTIFMETFYAKGYKKEDVARAFKMLQNEGILGGSINRPPCGTWNIPGEPYIRSTDFPWNKTIYVINKRS